MDIIYNKKQRKIFQVLLFERRKENRQSKEQNYNREQEIPETRDQ